MSEAVDALWRCQGENCGVILRDAEVRRIITPVAAVEVCAHCGAPVATIATETAERAVVPSFASALVYPFRGWGLMALGAGTFLAGLLAFGVPFLYGYVISILVYGYMCNYLFDVVLTTANNRDTPPEFPDFTCWWEDILRPILLMVSTTFLCFAPSFLYFVLYLVHCWYEGWAPEPDEPVCAVGVVGFALVSVLYYPMALLAVVMHDVRRAAAPHYVFPAIARVFRPYLVVCGFMALTGLVQVGFRLLFTRDLLLVHFAAVFLNLWGAMVSMRLLGLLYRANKEKLGWF